ncbi:HlyD family secretion protein [Sphingomonas sp. C3-2]|uniref:HlyD family secretion protein n=1 Tax=Sphingomonas sp. C3-2 TaxID=3062169 RepID=UPI00294B496D|nr:HlyD family secretion protein [Sphingomonas sp. C3-2]WOK37022.1 HlyD family secretion protein [Sphingomonas sp. C3-2]
MADSGEAIRFDKAEPMTSAPEAPATKRKRPMRLAAMFSVPLLIAGTMGYFWLTSGRFISTDNAYVQQDKVSVASEINGLIVEVKVGENQRVKKGDLLFRIDPAPYRIALADANAAIASAQVSLATMESNYRGTAVDIAASRDTMRFAQQEYDRQAELMRRGFTTKARLDATEHALIQARESLRNAQAAADEARAKISTGSAVPGQNPEIAAAQVRRDKALLDLSRTEVRAPSDGTVSQSTRLQVGQMMMASLPALSVVVSDKAWVEANFKETDLKNMAVGQPATVTFDAYPELKLKGHVESIGAGTGSEFSVLPAQNANGNWVKVTQRVPVRVAIDDKPSRQMIAGLSAEVTVDTKNRGNR